MQNYLSSCLTLGALGTLTAFTTNFAMASSNDQGYHGCTNADNANPNNGAGVSGGGIPLTASGGLNMGDTTNCFNSPNSGQ
ncbi:MAG TPA: hypothetical protein VEP90_30840 [Methylomirabilota bacterium]|nr:hypothetical protein [Methylomirabilota bacterium]